MPEPWGVHFKVDRLDSVVALAWARGRGTHSEGHAFEECRWPWFVSSDLLDLDILLDGTGVTC